MENKKKGLGLTALIAIAVGQVVGAGIITTTGLAIAQTGRSVWIAYALAVFFGFVWILPTVFFSSVARYKGGAFTQVKSLLGDLPAGLYGLFWIPMISSFALVGTGTGAYIHALIPQLSVAAGGIIVTTFFYVINMFGVHLMAKVEKPMTVVLLIGLMTFAVVGFTRLQPGSFDFSAPDYFLKGSSGFFAGLVLLVYSTGGHALVQAFSWEAEKPRKDISKAILIATVIIFILYVSVSFVAGNVLPVETVAGQPLTYAAGAIFGKTGALIFILLGPIMALLTTMNSGWAALSAPMLGAIRNGWLPKGIAKTNKYGAPWIIYTVEYLVAVIPMLLGVSLSSITSYTVMTQRICGTIVCIAMFALPTVLKDAWEKSWLHMPNGLYYAISVFSTITQIIAVVISAKNLGLKGFLMNIGVVAVLGIYGVIRYKSGKTSAKAVALFGDDADDPEMIAKYQ
ncbi:MAG: APC family permease [Oscillospiraceae bacterium]|nr:APC family permease [Oscillospiraceae bacterium]